MPSERINNEALRVIANKEEPRFISMLLKDKECLMEAVGYGIKPGNNGHFWVPKCRMLYNFIHQHYIKHGALLTRSAIESIMDGLQEYEGKTLTDADRVKARSIWDSVYNLHVNTEDFQMLLYNINNRFIQWQAWEIMKKYSQQLASATNEQVDLVKEIREKFISIENMDADHYTVSMDLEEQGIDDFLNYARERRENPEESAGIFCGIQALDDIFNGFVPGSYTIITGMINGGKTTLMMNMAWNMARAGYSVVYVSLEKKARMVFSRMMCCEAMVDFNKLKRGGKSETGLDDETFTHLIKTAEEVRNRHPQFVCIQMPQYTELSRILARVDKVRSIRKIDALFVDYLGVIKNETVHSGNPYYDDAITSRRLMSYGTLNQIATFTAQQLKTPSSKEIRGKASKATQDNMDTFEINTEDLSGTKSTPADADNVIGAVLNNDHPPTKMFVTISKARDDQSRIKKVLDFDGCLGKVSDPVLEGGHLQEIDDYIYSDDISDDDLTEDDGLFENISKSVSTSPDLDGDISVPSNDNSDEYDLFDDPDCPEHVKEQMEGM